MSTIILVPQGGLCNRLRAVLSAFSLVAEGRVKANIRCGWDVSQECAAHFDQLFLPFADSRLTIESRRWYDRPVTRYNLHWPAIVRSFIYSVQYRNSPPPVSDLQRKLSGGHSSKVYVSTGDAFCDYSPSYIQTLRPQPHLQERINALSSNFDDHTIGVHIRRTDHLTAIAESPDALFEQAMEDAINADSAAHFYLATDDAALKSRLAARFPGRITMQQCIGSRSDLAGMEEAVVDLWTLARTARLMGSYWSSFTDTAAEIGAIPLDIIRKPS